ncbi:hypothetical protein F4780DRAFT_768873 [Xylariomycetidae sp. FL0641]|nr:hypothetical protein F4780DRAFT_768873 [Xylariomycetidae sp. FL0641]
MSNSSGYTWDLPAGGRMLLASRYVRRSLSTHADERESPNPKRRRVRKGTHSCWECRRRKIRCRYSSEAAAVCVGRESRGKPCINQEFEDARLQGQTLDSELSQRVARVENLLEKLAGKPPPVLGIFKTLQPHDDPPATSSSPATTTASSSNVSERLHAMFPCQQDINAITSASWGVCLVSAFFSNRHDHAEGRNEPPSSIAVVPPVSSHPALLAKRLIQLVICLQQITWPVPPLVSKKPLRAQVITIASTLSELVVPNDELVGSVEGLEMLVLLSMYHANVGNLRKSWLTLRQALAVAQLMGLDQGRGRPLKSVDPMSDPCTRTAAHFLWFRINFFDRYLPLILGVAAGNDDASILDHENAATDTPEERLEKQHTVIAGCLIRRNRGNDGLSYETTLSIDRALEQAAEGMGEAFSNRELCGPRASPAELAKTMSRVMTQINHHNLLTLLHLPYMLRCPRESRWERSRKTCAESSRQVLGRFLDFRALNPTPFACRHVDYAALTATMTLILGYLHPSSRASDTLTTCIREADTALVCKTRDKLHEMGKVNDDRLSCETAEIIARLLPLIHGDIQSGQGASDTVTLDIPYLGTLNIKIHETSSSAGSSRAAMFPDPKELQLLEPQTSILASQASSLTAPYPNDRGDRLLTHVDGIEICPTQFVVDHGDVRYPKVTADADEWILQGTDTAYFESLFALTLLESPNIDLSN